MSHDTDKLIRQLSLVAFLMAERRPLTARDVKGNVEGYSEMSDEAFARRFYSDRAELIALGVPLHSQRDEFTGEELYTLRSENYFLAELELDDDELAALQTALYLLEGKFAYAEPLRLALQNLALGRPGLRRRADRDRPRASRCATPTTRPRWPAGSRSSSRRSRSSGRSSSATGRRAATTSASARSTRTRSATTAAPGTSSATISTTTTSARSASRASAATSASPPGASATSACRPTSTSTPTASARTGSSAPVAGTARIEVAGDTAWWVHRTLARGGHARGRRLRDRVRGDRAARRLGAAPERPRGAARARRSCAAACAEGLRRVRAAHEGEPPKLARGEAGRARRRRARAPRAAGRARALRASCRRCSPTCSPPAATAARRELDARRARASASTSRARSSQEHLSLLNLVNFGGGCYTVYAELDGDTVARRQGALRRRLPARAAADAARGAGDPARARVRRADDRGRRAHAARPRAHEARGDVRPVRGPPDAASRARSGDEEELVATLSDAIEQRRVVEIDYLKEGEETPSDAARRAVHASSASCRTGCVHTWDRTADGERSFRLDRMRSARLTDETFEPREGFDPHFLARPAARARPLLEADRPLEASSAARSRSTDGAALGDAARQAPRTG